MSTGVKITTRIHPVEDLCPTGSVQGYKVGKTTYLLWFLFGDSEFHISVLNLLTQHLREKMKESGPLGLSETGPNLGHLVSGF